MSAPLYLSSTTVSHRRPSGLEIGVFAATILFVSSVASTDVCTPSTDTVCEEVSINCIDLRNVSHFLSDVPKIQFIEDHIDDATANLTYNSSMLYRFDFSGSVALSTVYPLTFNDVHLPIIGGYELCEEYVNDFNSDLQGAIGDYLEMTTNTNISITGCEFDIAAIPVPTPAPSRKLMTFNQSLFFNKDMILFYQAQNSPDSSGGAIVSSPDERGVNSASVSGDIASSTSANKKRRLLSSRTTDEDSICVASLKFRGFVARSLNDTKPWESNIESVQSFVCNAEFKENSVANGEVQITISQACGISDGLRFMEESCGPSPLKSLTPPIQEFPETFPSDFDPISKVLPTLTSHQPAITTPDFLPDTDICNSSPEKLCDLKDVFGEELIQYMLAWFTPNLYPSIALLEEYYQSIC